MKKKKILITLLSLLSIGVSFVVGGCKNIENSSDPSGSGVSEEDNLPAEVLLNGFDSVADVYRVKQMIPVNCNFVGSLRVSKEIKKSGDGSLKVQYQETDGDIGEIIQRINQTDASERDVADIKQVSLWVYNDNTETASVNVNMLKSSNTVFLTTTVQLPPKEWTECVLDVNKVVLVANVNGFQGFSIEFNYKSLPAILYVDEWKVAFGAEYSEEDNVYLNKVAEIESDIGKIEGTLSENDLALMKKIGLAYDELPAEYKNSINNFVDYKKYITSVYKEKKEISNGTKDITTAYFNEFYGLSQVSMLNAASASLSYSEKVKYNGEGTLHIDCNGSDFSSVNIEANGNFKAYEKISFNVFNAWTENIVIWLNWQKSITSTADWTEIPAGEWVEFEVYTDSIPDNFFTA